MEEESSLILGSMEIHSSSFLSPLLSSLSQLADTFSASRRNPINQPAK